MNIKDEFSYKYQVIDDEDNVYFTGKDEEECRDFIHDNPQLDFGDLEIKET